ncbi:retrotransposon unclassified [Hordeum vulgare]|nr:retrotransposon unclassified [Hordeum vulgare]
MSRLKINFDKSEVVVLGYSVEEQRRIADNLNCKLAALPISYLGMPLAESRILVSGFDPLVGRVASRAEPWCGRFTSKGSKIVLISANLASLPMYMMGMYILSEGVHSSFDKELARIFWQAGDGIKHDIRLGLRISVGNGSGTQFWLDPWLDGEPLHLRFPRLSAICADPAALVAASARQDGWHVAFRRPLGPAEVHEWETLQVVVPLPVSSDRDSVFSSLYPSGNFSVSSAYLAMCRTLVLPWLSPLWKAPLPLKIKIFVWQLLRDRLPSRTEVLKRHGLGNGTCPLCHVPENGTHILFSCVAAQALWGFVREALGPEWEAHDLADFLHVRATQAGRKRRLFWLVFTALTWTLWTTRNKMVIEGVFERHASDSFFKFLAFLQHWHPLVRPRDRDRLQGYLDALMMSARRLSPRPHVA